MSEESCCSFWFLHVSNHIFPGYFTKEISMKGCRLDEWRLEKLGLGIMKLVIYMYYMNHHFFLLANRRSLPTFISFHSYTS